ncbi:histidinol-phosphate aminotransferase family protein [Myxococcota bacterium]|nr:histidinol-phosphate aminotransferase family protein [Myxococcota bacterium]
MFASRQGGSVIQETPKQTTVHTLPVPAPSRATESLAPYDAVSSLSVIRRLPRGAVPLKLDWNESSIPPTPKVIEAITGFLANGHHLNWYPELGATGLREDLARYTGVPADGILVTNGSDDALDLLCRTFIDPGDDVVVVWPTYGHFLIFARGRGVEPRKAMPPDPFQDPVSTLLEMLTPSTRMVYLPSPANPTGVLTSPQDVASLCRAFPATLFVVDEAYYEFAGITSAPLVQHLPNLAVTRTFSKCFGIAGLRVGYLLAGPYLIGHLRKLYNPKSVNALAQVGARAALADVDAREAYIAQVRGARAFLVTELRRRGAEVRNSEANFINVRVRDPKRLVQALESVAVFVRDRSHLEGFEGYIRITIGTLSQMNDLVERIDLLLEREPDLLAAP